MNARERRELTRVLAMRMFEIQYPKNDLAFLGAQATEELAHRAINAAVLFMNVLAEEERLVDGVDEWPDKIRAAVDSLSTDARINSVGGSEP